MPAFLSGLFWQPSRRLPAFCPPKIKIPFCLHYEPCPLLSQLNCLQDGTGTFQEKVVNKHWFVFAHGMSFSQRVLHAGERLYLKAQRNVGHGGEWGHVSRL